MKTLLKTCQFIIDKYNRIWNDHRNAKYVDVLWNIELLFVLLKDHSKIPSSHDERIFVKAMRKCQWQEVCFLQIEYFYYINKTFFLFK